MARRPGGEAEIQRRMATAPGLTAQEAHTLAGLLDAEGHFGMAPNNRVGWRCFCSINLRDDDRDVLIRYREKLGLGHLKSVPARKGSRAQVCWTITSKLECLALVHLLDWHPLRARKRNEYELWREAVEVSGAYGYGVSAGWRARLTELAGKLRAARIYRDPLPSASPADLSDAWAPHYFAGFFSGEGSFGLGHRSARLVIKVRRDDRPLLERVVHDFKLGKVRDVSAPAPWAPASVWYAVSARDVLSGIEIFDGASLLGRKRRQYGAWRPAAEAIARAIVTRSQVDRDIVENGRSALARATAYRPPAGPMASDDAASAARNAYVDVLQQWAATTAGGLTCTAYAAARRSDHPDWPKRETLAATFGSWYDALEAAGVAERAVRRPSVL